MASPQSSCQSHTGQPRDGGILLQDEGTAATPLVSAGLKGDTGSARWSDESTAGKGGGVCKQRQPDSLFWSGFPQAEEVEQMTDFKDTLLLLLNVLCFGDRSHWVK